MDRTQALETVLSAQLYQDVCTCKLLMVGAGGIGCELLKNLVLSGFNNIEIIDLDTIDVSNLNRQFLFRREHVGKSKAVVARESALRFNSKANIVAHHGDIKTSEYGVGFFKQFKLVFNALDNLSARKHVNRMCLAAGIPLIESGSGGYLGQSTVILKGVTECFECQPTAAPKQHPVCTIRNTPSLPIHCIVWAKFLFQQLFGRADDENDISPDTADPEAAGKEANGSNVHSHVSLRNWAIEHQYDPSLIFDKLFSQDVQVLLSMAKLWERRVPPRPLTLNSAKLLRREASDAPDAADVGKLKDQRVWDLNECAMVFLDSAQRLRKRYLEVEARMDNPTEASLDWDKDDADALDFVVAASNVRSHVFNIPLKSRFDVKSIAGNIIPAIATTNAIVAGLVVMEAFKLLRKRPESCLTTYLAREPNQLKRLLRTTALAPPNPECFVCSKRNVNVTVNVNTMTLGVFEEKVLKGQLTMVAPEIMLGAKIILSADDDDDNSNREAQLARTFTDRGIVDGSILNIEDFLQDYQVQIHVSDDPNLMQEEGFILSGSTALATASAPAQSTLPPTAASSSSTATTSRNGNGHSHAGDDDLILLDDGPVTSSSSRTKRAADSAEDQHHSSSSKRLRVEENDIIEL